MSFTPVVGSIQNNSPYPDNYYSCQPTGAPWPSLAAITESAFPSAYRAPGKGVFVQNGTKVDLYILDMNLAWQLGSGAGGKSAYDLWKDAGNTGTQAQFLASLVGPGGSNAGFRGQAVPASNPGIPAMEIWYFASGAGTYTNYKDSTNTAITVSANDGVVILAYEGGNWKKVVVPIDLSNFATKDILPVDNTVPGTYQQQILNDPLSVHSNSPYPVIWTFINKQQGTISFDGIVTKFTCDLRTAVTGRTVNFGIFREVNGQLFCKYLSPNTLAELAGNNELTGVKIPVLAGDMIGVYANVTDAATGVGYIYSGGASGSTGRYIEGKPAQGQSYPLLSNDNYFVVGGTVETTYRLVSEGHANKPNGYLQLDAGGNLPAEFLPAQFSNSLVPRPPANVIYSEALNSYQPNTYPLNNAYGQQYLFVDLAPANAARADGLVSVFEAYTAEANAGRGAKFYVLQPTGGTTLKVIYESPVVSCPGAGKFIYESPVNVKITQGSFIGCRVTVAGSGLGFSGGAAPSAAHNLYRYDNAVAVGGSYQFVQDDASRVMPVGGIVAYTSNVRFANMNWANLPGGFVGLDQFGNFPNNIGREGDSQWKGKKIMWYGTSLEADDYGGFESAGVQAGRILGATVINEAVGGSRIMTPVLPVSQWLLSLSTTIAEYQPAEANAGVPAGTYSKQSYENKVLGKNADLYVFAHGYNDRGEIIYPSSLGTIDSMDRATFFGAYNYVLTKLYEEKPLAKVAFITSPPYFFTHPVDNNSHNPFVINAIREAMKKLGEKWSAPVLDAPVMTGINQKTFLQYISDGTHFYPAMRKHVARVYYNFLKNIF